MTQVTLVCSCKVGMICTCEDAHVSAKVAELRGMHEGHNPTITVSERRSGALRSRKAPLIPILHGPSDALCSDCEGSGLVYSTPSQRYEGVKCWKCEGRGTL